MQSEIDTTDRSTNGLNREIINSNIVILKNSECYIRSVFVYSEWPFK